MWAMEQDMGVLESWCIDMESVQTLLNAGHQYGSCVAPCLPSCHFLPLPAASFQLQAVLSVPQNLSWCVCFTSFISCPSLIDFLSFTHCFQALFSSTWSLFLKTRNLLFTDHMLSAIISQFWECSQQGNSGTRSDGLTGNVPSSHPCIISELEEVRREGEWTVYTNFEAGRREMCFISAFSGTDHHLNGEFYYSGPSNFQLRLLIFPWPPIFLMLFSRLYWILSLFSFLNFLLLSTLWSLQALCLTSSQSHGAQSLPFFLGLSLASQLSKASSPNTSIYKIDTFTIRVKMNNRGKVIWVRDI